jgi:hypothetical protein
MSATDMSGIVNIQKSVSKIGSGDARCEKCPGACETVCTEGDTKCLAELRKSREAAFAACAKRK